MTRGRIDIVGLGPAGADLITAQTSRLIGEISTKRLRTSRHPAAAAVVGALSYDDLYERYDDFDAVYSAIVDDLVNLARSHGRVLYAVPGSPGVAERTVEMLLAQDEASVTVHPALSFADLAWVELGVDPIAQGVRIVDGHRFATEAAGERGPLLVSQCHDRQTLSNIKLAVDAGPELTVTVLSHLGLAEQSIAKVAWPDLDREIQADHLTSLYIDEIPTPVATSFANLAVLVERLRSECPWDREQDHATLRRYLLEESYETLEAIDLLVDAPADSEELDDRYRDLCEELGDLLYQVFFHSILAQEQGWFDVAAVAQGIHDKLVERHPHVFAGEDVSVEDLPARWEAAKRVEKSRGSVMDGIPAALPALLHASKVYKKAATVGIDLAPGLPGPGKPPGPPGPGKHSVGPDEDSIGEMLFGLVAQASEHGIDAESALRRHSARLVARVRYQE